MQHLRSYQCANRPFPVHSVGIALIGAILVGASSTIYDLRTAMLVSNLGLATMFIAALSTFIERRDRIEEEEPLDEEQELPISDLSNQL